MKEIVTIKTVEVEERTYIASDGTKFDNENDCMVHEKRDNSLKLDAEFEKICLYSFEDMTDYEHTHYILNLKDKSDVCCMVAYAKEHTYDGFWSEKQIETLIENLPTKAIMSMHCEGSAYLWCETNPDTDELVISPVAKLSDTINEIKNGIDKAMKA